jgi:hypothetical protein
MWEGRHVFIVSRVCGWRVAAWRKSVDCAPATVRKSDFDSEGRRFVGGPNHADGVLHVRGNEKESTPPSARVNI